MKILIADDNPMNLKLLRVVLEAEDHAVHAALDGVEALEILKREPVDAIISDILMPRMDGYRLCQAVRQSDQWRHLPYIVYTATYTSPSDEGLALKVGADAYLRKPAAVKDLLATLDKVLTTPRSETPLLGENGESQVVMKEYNEALIRKLEHKNHELERAQATIVRANEDLEDRVRERTAELQAANMELEAFSHSAAHDLRTPLRAINGHCQILLEDFSTQLGDDGLAYLHRIRSSTRNMNDLIEELLKLSRVGRGDIRKDPVNLSELVEKVSQELAHQYPDQPHEFSIAPGLFVHGDEALLRIAVENLLGNAMKFSSKKANPRIEFGTIGEDGTMFIRDNGAGFDPLYADKLFSAFHRMHAASEFSGTGLGLTIVYRVITRHGGEVWADGAVGEGATFFFRLQGAG